MASVGCRMSDRFRKDGEGTCPACGSHFPYMMIHNGFNDSAFAYCDSCGGAALLDVYGAPKGISLTFGPIPEEIETRLAACPCGGHFRSAATPRCPSCHAPLDAKAVASFIEANAPGAKKGWKWQRSWNGIYCVVVAKPPVENPWLTTWA